MVSPNKTANPESDLLSGPGLVPPTIDNGTNISTAARTLDSGAKEQALAKEFIGQLKDALTEPQGDKIGNPEKYLKVIQKIREVPDLAVLKAVKEGYPNYLQEIYDLGVKSNFSAGESIYISSYMAVTMRDKENVIAGIMENYKHVPDFSKEAAVEVIDSLLNAKNYKSIEEIYEKERPGASFAKDLAAEFPEFANKMGKELMAAQDSKIIVNNELTLAQQVEALKKEVRALKNPGIAPNEEPLFGTKPAPSGPLLVPPVIPPIGPLAPAVGPAAAGPAPKLVPPSPPLIFDWEANIVHPGLRKFIRQMNDYRISDPVKFTSVMNEKDFDVAKSKYDLMLGDIKTSTENNALYNSSTKLGQRLAFQQSRLKRAEAQLENSMSGTANRFSSSSSSRGSGYSNIDPRIYRLQLKIDAMRDQIDSLEDQYAGALLKEGEKGLIARDAYDIQKNLFDKYEKAGTFNRALLPRPENDLKEKLDSISNPKIYVQNYETPKERAAFKQKEDEAQAQYEKDQAAEKKAKIASMYKVELEDESRRRDGRPRLHADDFLKPEVVRAPGIGKSGAQLNPDPTPEQVAKNNLKSKHDENIITLGIKYINSGDYDELRSFVERSGANPFIAALLENERRNVAKLDIPVNNKLLASAIWAELTALDSNSPQRQMLLERIANLSPEKKAALNQEHERADKNMVETRKTLSEKGLLAFKSFGEALAA
jgi:hypothetical protein